MKDSVQVLRKLNLSWLLRYIYRTLEELNWFSPLWISQHSSDILCPFMPLWPIRKLLALGSWLFLLHFLWFDKIIGFTYLKLWFLILGRLWWAQEFVQQVRSFRVSNNPMVPKRILGAQKVRVHDFKCFHVLCLPCSVNYDRNSFVNLGMMDNALQKPLLNLLILKEVGI